MSEANIRQTERSEYQQFVSCGLFLVRTFGIKTPSMKSIDGVQTFELLFNLTNLITHYLNSAVVSCRGVKGGG